MVGEVQRKQCTNLVMIWTKVSKEILGGKDLTLPCTGTFSVVSLLCQERKE